MQRNLDVIGHSERRALHRESEAEVLQKLQAANRADSNDTLRGEARKIERVVQLLKRSRST